MKTKKSIKVLLITLVITALFLLILFYLASQMDVAFGDLTRDVFHLGDIPIYSGILSNIGVFAWIVSSSICFFTYISLRFKRGKKTFIDFLLLFGILSSLLLLDDFFMLHERFYNRILRVPEKVVFGVYGLVLIFGLLRYRRVVLRTDYLLLGFSLVLIGMSIFVDVLQNYLESKIGIWRIVLEDGLKFIGIIVWAVYFVKTCYKEIKLINSPE